MNTLDELLKDYASAPELYKTTRYWREYEKKIIRELKKANLEYLRSGKYPVFATFGFSESVYHYPHSISFWKKSFLRLIRKYIIGNRKILPYSLRLKDIREMAYRHAELSSQLAGAPSVSTIEASGFGKPNDLFDINGKVYSMQFLTFFIRYCFVFRHLNFSGNEVIIELGSGSGHQIEILKKLHPNLTVICFDLPAPLYLCEVYLTNVLGSEQVVNYSFTKDVTSLESLQRGKVYLFPSWMFPLVSQFKFDLFWNSASFGEMEPNVVENYLKQIGDNSNWIYLLQAEHGKEGTDSTGVETPMTFDFYNKTLKEYSILQKEFVYQAHRRMSQSGGYFQAIWKRK